MKSPRPADLGFGRPPRLRRALDLPKENPQFSIQMPDKWEIALEEDNVTARPAKNSKVIISVFPVPAAKNIDDAFAIATKQVSAICHDVKVGKLSEQKQAGLSSAPVTLPEGRAVLRSTIGNSSDR
jgi:hypothetical protein